MTVLFPLSIIAISLASSIFAIDGDTIVVGKEHIRILNIDAPEIHHAQCDDELALGMAAKVRMEELIHSGKMTLERGDKGRMKDRFGRSLARVFIDGQDIGKEMVSEGLAREWDGRRHPWCK